MRRDGSRFPLFVQRIPAHVRRKAVGFEFAIPLGNTVVFMKPSEGAQAVRFSLRTTGPSEVKTRQALATPVWEPSGRRSATTFPRI